jgi:hypothetical protein
MIANTGPGNHSLHEKPHLLLSQFFGIQSILILSSEKSSPQTPTVLNINFITGRLRARALQMVDFSTFALMDFDLDSDLDMSLDDPMDWEDFGTVGPMDVGSDSDDDISLDDPMDWGRIVIVLPRWILMTRWMA